MHSQVLLIFDGLGRPRLCSLPNEHTLVRQTPACCISHIVPTSQAVRSCIDPVLAPLFAQSEVPSIAGVYVAARLCSLSRKDPNVQCAPRP